MRNLLDLVDKDDILESFGDLNINIKGVTDDSRQVERGFAFVCMPRVYESEHAHWIYRTDGHDYILDAVKNGATAIVSQKPLSDVQKIEDVTFIRVKDTRATLAKMSLRFFDNPSQRLKMVGVTGTNGKTSTCYLSRSILSAAGLKTAILGTIVQRVGGKDISANMTTIEAPRLQKILYDILQEGFDAVVMEVSSHALELKRVDGIDFDVAVFTNITQDHLDFHKGMSGYLEAKTKLFRSLGKDSKRAVAVVNVDDPASEYIISNTVADVITYSLKSDADIKVNNYFSTMDGLEFDASIRGHGELKVRLQLMGEYNLYNALASIGVGISQGLNLQTIVRGLEDARVVPGRFEPVKAGQDFAVVVDYAHTPDALERVLTAARKLTNNRVITVFGCGGDRDKTKRPLMGHAATQLSDYVIVTSDNPRSEDPMEIISQILGGIKGNNYEVEPDRALAIQKAIKIAKKGDIVVIAGKGHENYQIIKGEKIHFDDREVALEALKKLVGETDSAAT